MHVRREVLISLYRVREIINARRAFIYELNVTQNDTPTGIQEPFINM